MIWVATFFSVLCLCNIILDSISLRKSSSQQKKQVNTDVQNTAPKHSFFDIVVAAISFLCFGGLIVFLFWNKTFPKKIVTLCVIVPFSISYINNAIKYSGPIKNIVLGDNSDLEFTAKDRYSLDIIGMTFIYIYSLFFNGKLEQLIIGLPITHIIVETLLVMYSTIVSFSFSFFIIVELIRPIKHLQKISLKIIRKMKTGAEAVTDKLLSVFDDKSFITARFTNRFLVFSSVYKPLFKILIRIVFVPCVLVIDVIIELILFIYCYLVCGIILVFLEFVSLFGKGIVYLINTFSNIPERRVVKNTFRLSLIISVISVVVINRYALIYKYDESFLTIFEFIASAIIIPVMFEWIYNYKEKTNMQVQHTVSSPPECPNNSKKNSTRKNVKHKHKRNK